MGACARHVFVEERAAKAPFTAPIALQMHNANAKYTEKALVRYFFRGLLLGGEGKWWARAHGTYLWKQGCEAVKAPFVPLIALQSLDAKAEVAF